MTPHPSSHLRIARPSRDVQRTERFWVDGLGLQVLYRTGTEAEGGHALVMLGWPEAAWHLELIDDPCGETPPSPTEVASHLRWKIGDGRGFLVGMLSDGCNRLVELVGRVFGAGRVEQLAA
jgi:catechol 2,3-dioxygenase-like lactoylglutathione lyase family enzyme